MALSPDDQDAVAYLTELLRGYGLSELSTWAYEQVVSGNSPTMIRQLLWEQPAFKKRFKVIFDRRDKGLSAISVDEVLDYERKARQLFQSAGLPPGFYDSPDDFYNFLVNDVSLSELNSRVELARDYIYSSAAEFKAEAQRLYGITDGGLIAYALDANRAVPLLQSQFMAARNAAAATQSGYGQLTRTEAERLASLGVDPSQAQSRFGALVQSRQLFNALPGQETAEDAITREEQLGAAFGGDANAQARLTRRGERRAAAFQGGGGFAGDREGFGGLGKANS
jgi:hypothetical protein